MYKVDNKIFFYRVKENESVNEIAKKFSLCVFDIISDNRLTLEVSAGDMLVLRNRRENLYSVKAGENKTSVAKKFNTSCDSILMKNGGIPYLFYGIDIKV